MPSRPSPSVLVIGAGFGGIAAAIELREHGIEEITILEAAPEIGGTWFHNTYPGAACDIPSPLYSYSYARSRDWSRLCAPQAEILDYLQGVARDEGITPLVHTNSPVQECTWSEEDQEWTAMTARGERHTAGVLIVATGQLNRPRFPDIPGIDRFSGEVFHSARWEHDVPLAGRRIAVIGNGASAVQFVPEIAKEAAEVKVFQRTGNWFLPRENAAYSEAYRRLLQRVPKLQDLRRRGMFLGVEELTRTIRHPRTYGQLLRAGSWAFMRWQLRGDPGLRAKVWPDYTFGCKRILFSSHFLPALRRPNVDLVTERITEITETGVRTADGAEHEVDVLIHATGFHATDFMLPMAITGTSGQRLQDAWTGGAHAHLGMTVPGFPSLFVLYGPNTNTSGGSIIVYLEAQAAYVRQAIELLRDRGAGSIEVRPEVEAASDRALQSRFAGTAWLACDSWYRAEGGRIVANWPDSMQAYLARTAQLDPSEFTLAPARVASAAVADSSETA